MAKIINIKSVLKTRETERSPSAAAFDPNSLELCLTKATPPNTKTCRHLLESLTKFADLVDKQVADLGKI